MGYIVEIWYVREAVCAKKTIASKWEDPHADQHITRTSPIYPTDHTYGDPHTALA